jgi:hypothetical protein
MYYVQFERFFGNLTPPSRLFQTQTGAQSRDSAEGDEPNDAAK